MNSNFQAATPTVEEFAGSTAELTDTLNNLLTAIMLRAGIMIGRGIVLESSDAAAAREIIGLAKQAALESSKLRNLSDSVSGWRDKSCPTTSMTESPPFL
jgi:hypothetical protein